MTEQAILTLEDGSIYEGFAFGAETGAYGEVVFNTGMVGYQEMLTDPSYAGQILVPTYPLVGNYGINKQDFESNKIQVSGFVVRGECPEPSHYLSHQTLHQYLAESGIPGIYGAVFGGHMTAGGNPVLATLDAVIAEIPDVKMVRQLDDDIGMGVNTPGSSFVAEK